MHVGKSLYHPLTYGGGWHNPPTYETVSTTPELFKTGQITPPKSVLKNDSKSEKNYKMENPIVLDSEWVDLHSKYIIWYALVYTRNLAWLCHDLRWAEPMLHGGKTVSFVIPFHFLILIETLFEQSYTHLRYLW